MLLDISRGVRSAEKSLGHNGVNGNMHNPIIGYQLWDLFVIFKNVGYVSNLVKDLKCLRNRSKYRRTNRKS